jgi:hypothetical protein
MTKMVGLMAALERINKIMWALRPHRFWMIWFATALAAVIFVMMVIWRQPFSRNEESAQAPNRQTAILKTTGTISTILALALLTVFLTSYIAMILVWEDFSYYDDDMFTLSTIKGHDLLPAIWHQNGRFFPFGHLEFNFVRHFTHSAVGYQILPITELLVFAYILLILDKALSLMARVMLIIWILLTPSVLISFGGLIFPERNVLLFLVCLALSVSKFEELQSGGWALAAVVFAQVMLYYKETVFILLLGFATARLSLRWIIERRTSWNYARLWNGENCLNLCLGLLALVFPFCYLAVMGIHRNMSYLATERLSGATVLLEYLRRDLLAVLLMLMTLRRAYIILRHGAVPSLLWDGLAFGGVAYFLGFLSLRSIFSSYFTAPVDLIAVLYVGRLLILSWEKQPAWSKGAILMLASVVVLQGVLFSSLALFERKNEIHGQAQIASVIEEQYRENPRDVIRLFFPFSKPYLIMGLAAYLDYRGVPLDKLVLASKAIREDGPCVDYHQIICRAADKPAPGDLVIILPDDEVSLAEASLYQKPEELLLFYRPWPFYPQWLYSLTGNFPVATPKDRRSRRSDRWMDASVSKWK